MTIRQIKHRSEAPDSEPKRYPDRVGYIRLRWHVGPRQYVEMREHRFVAEETLGRPLRDDEHVHHVNHDRGDNRPENLRVMANGDHQRQHKADRRAEWADMKRLYEEELMTTTAIGEQLGIASSTVLRTLRDELGVQMRSLSEALRTRMDDDLLVRLHGTPGYRVPQIAEMLGVGEGSVRRRMRELGLPSFRAGNPHRG